MSFTHTTSSQEAAMFAVLTVVLSATTVREECGCTVTLSHQSFRGEDGSTWEGVRSTPGAVCGVHGGEPQGCLTELEALLLDSM